MCFPIDCEYENEHYHCDKPQYKICPKDLKESVSKDFNTKISEQINKFSATLNNYNIKGGKPIR